MAILRAGLFERVSTEEQAKLGYSIRDQHESLEEYCEKNKIKIVDHYCDEGVSAGKPYKKRPEMKRLLEDVQAGKIDLILFTRLDRWFRNVPEYFKVQEILDDNKVQWKAIWEDYDTTTANGRMAITIFLAIAQAEREKSAERIKSVFENKRKNKEAFFGWKTKPFGYIEQKDKDGVNRLVKDPDLEDAIQEFWDVAIKYENINKAAKHVNLTYGLRRTKKLWYELAHKEIYTGTYKGVVGYCPEYVSREDWEKLQNRPQTRNTKANRVYLFSGLIKCPKCGCNLTSAYTAPAKKKEYKYYRCSHKSMKLCLDSKSVFELRMETWLLDNLESLLKNEIATVEIEKNKPTSKPKTNIALLKEDLRRLEVVYRAGNKSDDDYITESKELNDAIRKAEKETSEDPFEKDLSAIKKLLETDFVSIYKTLDKDDQKRFWKSLIKEIHVEGPNIVSVDFN